MTAIWRPLRQELDKWREDGLRLPIWWRDDDAVAATPALDELARLSTQTGLPVHLAVIPHHAQADLGRKVAATPQVIPVVHGWAHVSHAPSGEKKAEFGAHRPIAQMATEADQGRARLSELFKDRLRHMFVPPWNRIADDLPLHLAKAGYQSVSTYLPRKARKAAPGLVQINTHLDPIDWKGTRGLIEPDRLIAHLVKLLEDRRRGITDASEPLGLLTHHLVHDTDVWVFMKQLIEELRAGPTEIWTHPAPGKDTLP
ncbi:polysaccharide deacetylase family protein [Thalassococcus sp. S3]|uniref:polysaccharide deacetylase family protein n=1 Tax=Thalassococcus sp. S3 TaxID=2017482 RepID=UPI0010241041|nr:polysaccharide deacetylase family protein [Thalassococcus sp. S3]QBF30667.1 polysaccharide deacetylase [Thalassococcus sp. S3]